jgi:hypothetical protein
MFQKKFEDKIKKIRIIKFFFEKIAFCETMWRNIVELARPQMTWCMRISCWITTATNAPSEYVVLIAFPLQQWLHERASVLRYTCSACLVSFVSLHLLHHNDLHKTIINL